jgi:hypothetical protein
VTQPERDLDVAISFSSEDHALAAAIRTGLSRTLRIFEFTARQEELAGTDGLESLRNVFRWRARLVVILLRASWGKTPWTRVEMEAITDRFLKEGPDFLFVVTVDDGAVRPPWLPDKLLRFNFTDFPLEQALGAIMSRCLEQGATISRPSIAALAVQAQSRTVFEVGRRAKLASEGGVREAERELAELFKLVGEAVQTAKEAAPELKLEYGASQDFLVIRSDGIAVQCRFSNRYANTLEHARLMVAELRGTVLLPGQGGYYRTEPRVLAETAFTPDIGLFEGTCWRDENGALLTSPSIAQQTLERFFSLVQSQAAGELPPMDW